MFFNKCTLSKNKYVLHVPVGSFMKNSLCGEYDSIRKLKPKHLLHGCRKLHHEL